jgi:flagellar FliL protein
MADDMFDAEDDVVATEETQPGQKRVGFLPGVLIQVLKWTGIILAAIIFIVTVVVITVRVLNRGNTQQVRAPISADYESNIPRLEYFGQIGELRGTTGDEVRTTFVVEPYLGYRKGNDGLSTELIDRTIQLIGLFNDYFGTRTVDELEGAQGENRRTVELELIQAINNLLEEGAIEDIVFRSYQFLEF